MSGGTDISFLRGLRVPCCFALVLLLAALAGLGGWLVARLV